MNSVVKCIDSSDCTLNQNVSLQTYTTSEHEDSSLNKKISKKRKISKTLPNDDVYGSPPILKRIERDADNVPTQPIDVEVRLPNNSLPFGTSDFLGRPSENRNNIISRPRMKNPFENIQVGSKLYMDMFNQLEALKDLQVNSDVGESNSLKSNSKPKNSLQASSKRGKSSSAKNGSSASNIPDGEEVTSKLLKLLTINEGPSKTRNDLRTCEICGSGLRENDVDKYCTICQHFKIRKKKEGKTIPKKGSEIEIQGTISKDKINSASSEINMDLQLINGENKAVGCNSVVNEGLGNKHHDTNNSNGKNHSRGTERPNPIVDLSKDWREVQSYTINERIRTDDEKSKKKGSLQFIIKKDVRTSSRHKDGELVNNADHSYVSSELRNLNTRICESSANSKTSPTNKIDKCKEDMNFENKNKSKETNKNNIISNKKELIRKRFVPEVMYLDEKDETVDIKAPPMVQQQNENPESNLSNDNSPSHKTEKERQHNLNEQNDDVNHLEDEVKVILNPANDAPNDKSLDEHSPIKISKKVMILEGSKAKKFVEDQISTLQEIVQGNKIRGEIALECSGKTKNLNEQKNNITLPDKHSSFNILGCSKEMKSITNESGIVKLPDERCLLPKTKNKPNIILEGSKERKSAPNQIKSLSLPVEISSLRKTEVKNKPIIILQGSKEIKSATNQNGNVSLPVENSALPKTEVKNKPIIILDGSTERTSATNQNENVSLPVENSALPKTEVQNKPNIILEGSRERKSTTNQNENVSLPVENSSFPKAVVKEDIIFGCSKENQSITERNDNLKLSPLFKNYSLPKNKVEDEILDGLSKEGNSIIAQNENNKLSIKCSLMEISDGKVLDIPIVSHERKITKKNLVISGPAKMRFTKLNSKIPEEPFYYLKSAIKQMQPAAKPHSERVSKILEPESQTCIQSTKCKKLFSKCFLKGRKMNALRNAKQFTNLYLKLSKKYKMWRMKKKCAKPYLSKRSLNGVSKNVKSSTGSISSPGTSSEGCVSLSANPNRASVSYVQQKISKRSLNGESKNVKSTTQSISSSVTSSECSDRPSGVSYLGSKKQKCFNPKDKILLWDKSISKYFKLSSKKMNAKMASKRKFLPTNTQNFSKKKSADRHSTLPTLKPKTNHSTNGSCVMASKRKFLPDKTQDFSKKKSTNKQTALPKTPSLPKKNYSTNRSSEDSNTGNLDEGDSPDTITQQVNDTSRRLPNAELNSKATQVNEADLKGNVDDLVSSTKVSNSPSPSSSENVETNLCTACAERQTRSRSQEVHDRESGDNEIHDANDLNDRSSVLYNFINSVKDLINSKTEISRELFNNLLQLKYSTPYQRSRENSNPVPLPSTSCSNDQSSSSTSKEPSSCMTYKKDLPNVKSKEASEKLVFDIPRGVKFEDDDPEDCVIICHLNKNASHLQTGIKLKESEVPSDVVNPLPGIARTIEVTQNKSPNNAIEVVCLEKVVPSPGRRASDEQSQKEQSHLNPNLTHTQFLQSGSANAFPGQEYRPRNNNMQSAAPSCNENRRLQDQLFLNAIRNSNQPPNDQFMFRNSNATFRNQYAADLGDGSQIPTLKCPPEYKNTNPLFNNLQVTHFNEQPFIPTRNNTNFLNDVQGSEDRHASRAFDNQSSMSVINGNQDAFNRFHSNSHIEADHGNFTRGLNNHQSTRHGNQFLVSSGITAIQANIDPRDMGPPLQNIRYHNVSSSTRSIPAHLATAMEAMNSHYPNRGTSSEDINRSRTATVTSIPTSIENNRLVNLTMGNVSNRGTALVESIIPFNLRESNGAMESSVIRRTLAIGIPPNMESSTPQGPRHCRAMQVSRQNYHGLRKPSTTRPLQNKREVHLVSSSEEVRL